MNLIRLVTLLVVGWLLWRLYLRHYRRSFPVLRQPPKQTQHMYRCAHCGTHIPEAEALRDGEQSYCCPEHRTAARRGDKPL